jgi:hypothetical protein
MLQVLDELFGSVLVEETENRTQNDYHDDCDCRVHISKEA